MFSFRESSNTKLQGMRTLGAGELTTNQLSELIQVRFKFFIYLHSTISDIPIAS